MQEAFERDYALIFVRWANQAEMSEQIRAAVRASDTERAKADVACMTAGPEGLHVLIETWRECGDSEQDTASAVDEATAARKPRRPRAAQKHDTGAAESVEPESIDLPLEQAEVTPP